MTQLYVKFMSTPLKLSKVDDCGFFDFLTCVDGVLLLLLVGVIFWEDYLSATDGTLIGVWLKVSRNFAVTW